MAKKKKDLTTHVTMVLDETGSMYSIASDTRGAVNQYFKELATDFPDAVVSVMEFSDMFGAEPKYRTLCKGVVATEVPKLNEENYKPRGNTPLYDAIGKGIVDADDVEADRHLFIVMTDGYENASSEYTQETVKKIVDEKEASDNWTIVFLGANMDAWAVGGAVGTRAGSTMTYASTPRGMAATSSSLSYATKTLLSSPKSKSEDFFGDAGQVKEDYEGEPSK